MGSLQLFFLEIFFLPFFSLFLRLLLYVCWYYFSLSKASYCTYNSILYILWWSTKALLGLTPVCIFNFISCRSFSLISCSSYTALQLLLDKTVWRRWCVPNSLGSCYYLCLKMFVFFTWTFLSYPYHKFHSQRGLSWLSYVL